MGCLNYDCLALTNVLCAHALANRIHEMIGGSRDAEPNGFVVELNWALPQPMWRKRSGAQARDFATISEIDASSVAASPLMPTPPITSPSAAFSTQPPGIPVNCGSQ